MKRGLFVLALAFLFTSAGSAQDGIAFEPTYFSVFYYLQASGQTMELERQIPNLTPKGVETLFVIRGEKSPVRFHAGDEMQFVVRVTEDFDKAVATLQLFRYQVQQGARQLLLKNYDIRRNKATLKLGAERYGSSSLKVTPFQKLAPGEYCLSRATISQGFCFGVDEAGAH